MSATELIAVRLRASDNVATLLTQARAGSRIRIREGGRGESPSSSVEAAVDIPLGHKVALAPIMAGDEVVKYGLAIGHAIEGIGTGDHVHVHNVQSGLSAESPSSAAEPRPRSMAAEDLRRAVEGCLLAAGSSESAAANMSDAIVEAHLRGVETHGLRRLAPYIHRLQAGGVDARAEPMIESRDGVLMVDGRGGIGHHVAAVAADKVAQTAADHGIGCALIRNSNHLGFTGYYATRIAAFGMAAMVTSNGQVLVGPEGSRRALFSNNPIAIAAPLDDGSYFEFDMATSVTSRARLVAAAERGETIPEGLAIDKNGRPTTDPASAASGILLPFGGNKGFALIAAIELLTGVLSGGAYADLVASKELDSSRPEQTAHFMMAVSLEAAGGSGAFKSRLADMAARMANLPMSPGYAQPRHPGARRWRLRSERLEAGVPLTVKEAEDLQSLAERLGVKVGPR